jgi:hypothetical protein
LARNERPGPAVRLGLKENLGQFALLILVNAFVGGMVGLERTVVPLIGSEEFGLVLRTAIFSFIVTFGLVKAFSNLFGRKKVLVAGWLVGVPAPFILMLAPSWGWIVTANVLLGINQGLRTQGTSERRSKFLLRCAHYYLRYPKVGLYDYVLGAV